MIEGDRTLLAQAITLIESRQPADQAAAQQLLQRLLPRSGKARRIGITGIPGVGKSTFIEAFGCLLCEKGHRVAVLTIDPTSQRGGGSILGDKTRMDRLSREPNAYIRPSPSGDALGGVARRTREAMIICEAAGFDVMIAETVGVGQSEVTLRSMVDFFLLLMLPGAGDELQGIKRGILEFADLLFVNKADGDNLQRAELARAEFALVMNYMPAATEGWKIRVMSGSALTGKNIQDAWDAITAFYAELEPKGVIAERRRQQALNWLKDLVREEVMARFLNDAGMRKKYQELERAILAGEYTPPEAMARLFPS